MCLRQEHGQWFWTQTQLNFPESCHQQKWFCEIGQVSKAHSGRQVGPPVNGHARSRAPSPPQTWASAKSSHGLRPAPHCWRRHRGRGTAGSVCPAPRLGLVPSQLHLPCARCWERSGDPRQEPSLSSWSVARTLHPPLPSPHVKSQRFTMLTWARL